MFWLGREVLGPALRENLPGLDIEELEGIGLLVRQNGAIRSIAKLGPRHELLMASDFEPGIHSELSVDPVLGVNAASLTLANVTIRRKAKTALDLGTGAGIQAFLAARHSCCVYFRCAPRANPPYIGNQVRMAIPLRPSSESIILFSREIQKKVDTMQYSANNIGEHDGEYP